MKENEKLDEKDKGYYKFVSKVLELEETQAIDYIINKVKLSYRTIEVYFYAYIRINPDNLNNTNLNERKKYFLKIKRLYKIMLKEKKYIKQKGDLTISSFLIAGQNIVDIDFFDKNKYLLEEYVDRQCYIYFILEKYKKELNCFNNLLDKASVFDDKLYNQCIELIEFKERNVNDRLEEIVPTLLGYIKEGISINDEVVPFTILDYYTLFDVPLAYFFLYQGEKITKNDLHEIKLFIKEAYPKISRNENGFIRKDFRFLPFNKDYELKVEYTFIINGEYIKPSMEERTKILDYLEENDFPIDITIYKQALRRYAYGLLDVDDIIKRTF